MDLTPYFLKPTKKKVTYLNIKSKTPKYLEENTERNLAALN